MPYGYYCTPRAIVDYVALYACAVVLLPALSYSVDRPAGAPSGDVVYAVPILVNHSLRPTKRVEGLRH